LHIQITPTHAEQAVQSCRLQSDYQFGFYFVYWERVMALGLAIAESAVATGCHSAFCSATILCPQKRTSAQHRLGCLGIHQKAPRFAAVIFLQ
jgi:hypothetical protein